MRPDYRLTKEEARAVEARFENDREAHVLLDLINAEFQSDPTSVQCFDLRVVDRVKTCVLLNKKLQRPF